MAKYAKGLYRVELKAQRFGKTPKGSPYFEVDFVPEEKLDAVTKKADKVEGYLRNAQIFLTPAAIEKSGSLDRCKALGMEGSFRQYDPSNPGHTSLVGKKVLMFCHGPDEKGYDDWSVFVPGNKGEAKPRPASDPSVAAHLDNLLMGKLGPAKNVTAVGAATEPPAQSGEPDLPF